ncbi:hypothetical protein [Microcoleus sp. FACHB-672]|uniref:hypothetical protein n=1 Tax=Microcoleus sp. FACHB-672 TaxID=2692825 RepID=UPI001688608A|nr:hypothetical protein [Microcoleus sp. FACHB-672]MBD2041325.1 hypothetical protein [Microcoleus sp. FACHB-672]
MVVEIDIQQIEIIKTELLLYKLPKVPTKIQLADALLNRHFPNTRYTDPLIVILIVDFK